MTDLNISKTFLLKEGFLPSVVWVLLGLISTWLGELGPIYRAEVILNNQNHLAKIYYLLNVETIRAADPCRQKESLIFARPLCLAVWSEDSSSISSGR